ncbi:helix-turn-helix domain-containing protein [Methylomonas albis]|uniref:Helix-turn-helix domain-containing protein n=1 Tax=Methylomonas albis TaxID=1854563 RepID=A0ABR9D1X4_9GAMM|nr:helix-turn-helix domain-containing protein [Methylomonas albis]MBD9356796.1 helix-turn-helix domain-containing protein [Methylomonas albis]
MTIKEKKRAIGRPSAFKPEYVNQVYNYALLGATDSQLAGFFNVAESTINLWKKKFPEFAAAMTRGKMLADATVAEALFKRATGYSHAETKISVIDGAVVTTDIVKHHAPETLACIYWLKNRQPKLWKDRIEVKEESVVRIIPWDDLKKISKDALAFAEAEHERLIKGRAERLGITENYDAD